MIRRAAGWAGRGGCTARDYVQRQRFRCRGEGAHVWVRARFATRFCSLQTTALASSFAPNPSSCGATGCTMTTSSAVPCSIAAPPAVPSANVHRQVTRAPQFEAVSFALGVELPLQLPCSPRARATPDSACPAECVRHRHGCGKEGARPRIQNLPRSSASQADEGSIW
jgi:hypothetical protein